MTARRPALALLAVSALAAGRPASAAPAPSAALRVEGAWSRPVPAGLPNGVGYARIVNTGRAPDRLLSARSPVAARVELHESMTVNGPMGAMSHMAPVAGLDIPAGGEVRLAPGGRHLMLVGLKRALKPGESVPVTLVFAHAGAVPARFAVRSTAP